MIAAESVEPIGRDEGTRLSRAQYVRLVNTLDTLSPDEWAAPTACTGWDVKAVAGHVLGVLESVRWPREFVRQYVASRRLGLADWIDALNAVQVRDHADWSPARVAGRLRTLVEPGLRMRARVPAPLRNAVRLRMDVAGRVSLGWIIDVIYTRDVFIHRIDVARATGRDLVLDDVERRIVADMVREWAARHGEPVTLVLTGPAGETYACRGGGREVVADAVEFTLAVAGRAPVEGALGTPVQI